VVRLTLHVLLVHGLGLLLAESKAKVNALGSAVTERQVLLEGLRCSLSGNTAHLRWLLPMRLEVSREGSSGVFIVGFLLTIRRLRPSVLGVVLDVPSVHSY
jgi:hypothetical protein